MLVLLAALVAQPAGTGVVRIDAPSDSEVYVSGCEAELRGDRIHGLPGCEARVAVVHADGSVERHTVRLPSAAAGGTPKRDTGITPTAAVGFERDLGDFGFTGGSVSAGARYGAYGARIRWRRATGRATASALPDLDEHVEETLDLFTVGATYARRLGDHPLHLVAALDLGYGRLVAESVQTDRAEIPGATQPMWVLAPALGLELGGAWLRARVEWSAVFATGEYFEAGAYGATAGGPPEQRGLLAHGPWLAIVWAP